MVESRKPVTELNLGVVLYLQILLLELFVLTGAKEVSVSNNLKYHSGYWNTVSIINSLIRDAASLKVYDLWVYSEKRDGQRMHLLKINLVPHSR